MSKYLILLAFLVGCGKVKHEVGGEAKVAPIEAHIYYSIDPQLLELIEGICNAQSKTSKEYYKCMDERVFEVYNQFNKDKKDK